MDMLQITGLSVKTKIGIHAWEQRILQQLLLDIQIDADFSACNDELTNTLDYDALCQQVTAYVEGNAFKLIETVAEQVALLIKEKFSVTQVKISVSKPHAVKNAGNICVTIHR